MNPSFQRPVAKSFGYPTSSHTVIISKSSIPSPNFSRLDSRSDSSRSDSSRSDSSRSDSSRSQSTSSEFSDELSFDRTKTGEGMWFVLHMAAKQATTEEKKRFFLALLTFYTEHHHCGTCRNHMIEYVSEHPVKDYWNIKDDKGQEIGLFAWTFQFHNTVNDRLGKKQMAWDQVWKLYSDENMAICMQGCEEGAQAKPKLNFLRSEA